LLILNVPTFQIADRIVSLCSGAPRKRYAPGAASIGRIRFGHRGNAEVGMAVETDRLLVNTHDALCYGRPSHQILRLLAAQIPRDHLGMTTKSRQSIYGASVRYSAERARRRSHFVALRPTKISAND
jgi:hypothetical protein